MKWIRAISVGLLSLGLLALTLIHLASLAPRVLAQSTILINEVDSDTEGVDQEEFVELYDGGTGGTSLDGLLIVLFNGSNDQSYATIDLNGFATDANGYFVVGNELVASAAITFANGRMQNGTDAVALYSAEAADFTNGTAVTTDNLVDAVVYHTDDDPDTELQALLATGQSYLNESGGEDKDVESLQRCPDGSGGPRTTETFVVAMASPGGPCPFDLVAPDAPVMTQPEADALLDTNTPIIAGTGEAGARITVTVAMQVQSVMIGGDGAWSIQMSAAEDGVYTPTFTIADMVGNSAGPFVGNRFTIDATAPETPIITAPSPGSTVANNPPTLEGTAEAGVTINVLDGNSNIICTTTADSDGNWQCQTSALPEGEQQLAVRAVDSSSNESTDAVLTLVVGQQRGTIPDGPAEGQLYLPIINN